MGNVLIEFVINRKTGSMETTINGIKGEGCKPIHEQLSRDMLARLGIPEVSVEDTAEIGEGDVLDALTTRAG